MKHSLAGTFSYKASGLILILGLLLSACSKVKFAPNEETPGQTKKEAPSLPSPPPPPPPAPPEDVCQIEEENQDSQCPAGTQGLITQVRSREVCSETGAKAWSDWQTLSNTCAPIELSGEEIVYQEVKSQPLDVLFVIDNSNSMLDEQKEIGKRFKSFMSDINETDYHVGITTTDLTQSKPGFNGALDRFDNGELFLTKNSVNRDELFRKTVFRKETVDCKCASSDEQPLQASIRSFQKRNRENAGFFRDDAHLALIYVSDEDEMSDGGDLATRPREVINEINSIWGRSKEFSIYGIIIKPGDRECLRKQEEQNIAAYGFSIAELMQLSPRGGVIGSICEDSYGGILKSMSSKIRRELLVKGATLKHLPVEGSVSVEVIGGRPIRFAVSGKRIDFIDIPSEGTETRIRYRYIQ